ncbi:hypothetical protein ACQJBY_026227 [Aegilops geniculata]
MASPVDMLFNQEPAAAAMMTEAEGRVEGYFPSSSHGFLHFQQAGTAPIGVPDMGSPISGFGVSPFTFDMPEVPLPVVGYGTGVVPVEIPAVWQKKHSTKNSRAVAPSKGAWTLKEDELLKIFVARYGNQRWEEISKHLPGRIGKQCRERWTNHLQPNLKNQAPWTEEEDRKLIEEHKTLGNSWSKIAKRLFGRSENSIKNHWYGTKRGLTSKGRFRKRRFSLLEEYIRSTTAGDKSAASPSQSSAPPPGLGSGGQVVPSASAMLAVSSLPVMGTYLHPGNAPGSSSQGATMNLSSLLPELNTYGGEMQQRYSSSPSFPPNNLLHCGPPPAFQQMFSQRLEGQDGCANMNLSPLLKSLGLGGSYYCSETGRTSVGGIDDSDDINVV